MRHIVDKSLYFLHYNQKMPLKWDILGVGTAAVDDLFIVNRFPIPDEKLPVQSIHRRAGGQTATALVAAARQGATTAFFGQLGDDELSIFTIAELEKEGVDCSLVVISPGSQPFYAVVIVDSSAASRTILYSAEGVNEPDMNNFNADWISQSRVVFIDHNIPRGVLYAARLARERGVPIVADIESTTIPDLPELLSLVDHLIISRDFATRLTGKPNIEDMLVDLSISTRNATIITAGRMGCWYSLPGCAIQHVPAFPVRVVDTTGCGDVFHGTYAAAIARGEDIHRAVLIATASAGLKATQPGGRPGIPSLEYVREYLKNQGY
jgi:sulfofructose kinase